MPTLGGLPRPRGRPGPWFANPGTAPKRIQRHSDRDRLAVGGTPGKGVPGKHTNPGSRGSRRGIGRMAKGNNPRNLEPPLPDIEPNNRQDHEIPLLYADTTLDPTRTGGVRTEDGDGIRPI